MRLRERLGTIPRQAPDEVAERLATLWRERNAAAKDELPPIDEEMENLFAPAGVAR